MHTNVSWMQEPKIRGNHSVNTKKERFICDCPDEYGNRNMFLSVSTNESMKPTRKAIRIRTVFVLSNEACEWYISKYTHLIPTIKKDDRHCGSSHATNYF